MRCATLALAGVLGACALRVPAQQSEPSRPPDSEPARAPAPAGPSDDPVLSDPRLGNVPRDQPRTPDRGSPVTPAGARQGLRDVPSIPGLSLLDYRLPGRRGLPEGSFVSATPGIVVRVSTGDVVFVPDDAGPGKGVAPMALLASQRGEQVESLAAGAPETGARVVLTGQAFTYRSRHYLLVTAYSFGEGSSAAPGPAPVARPVEDDPRVAALIHDLESAGAAPRALQGSRAPDGAADADPGAVKEGTVLVNRRGRLVRDAGANGRLAFAVDNDPDAGAIPPLLLLPCRMLEEMELMAAAKGDELVFRVSGRTTSHRGRGYLLPTLVQVLPPADIGPMQ